MTKRTNKVSSEIPVLVFNRIGWPSTGGCSIGVQKPLINIRGQEDLVALGDHISDEISFVLESIQERFVEAINA
jgi:hypothetical protein